MFTDEAILQKMEELKSVRLEVLVKSANGTSQSFSYTLQLLHY
jgi:hypothetical protein